MDNKYRTCARCHEAIRVGKAKVGRVVFPGGICYDCWRKEGGRKKVRPVST